MMRLHRPTGTRDEYISGLRMTLGRNKCCQLILNSADVPPASTFSVRLGHLTSLTIRLQTSNHLDFVVPLST